MNKESLFLFPKMGQPLLEESESQKVPIRSSVENKFINKCADSFLESILSGELYQELKPKDINSKAKLIRI